MKTITISNTYKVSGFIEQDESYILTECNKVINIKTRRVIKPYLLFGQKGFYLRNKFVPLSEMKLNTNKVECPF